MYKTKFMGSWLSVQLTYSNQTYTELFFPSSVIWFVRANCQLGSFFHAGMDSCNTVFSFLAGVIFAWSFPGPHCMGLFRDPGVQEIFITWESVRFLCQI